MDPVQLRTSLGLAEDATDEQVTEALAAAAAAIERASAAEARVAELEKQAHVPEGHVIVPEARLKDLEEGTKLAAEVAEKIRVKERDEFLDSVRGKYALANREAWAKEYDRDPEGTRKHFESAPVIVPLATIGTEASDLDEDRDYREAVQIFGEATARSMFGKEPANG